MPTYQQSYYLKNRDEISKRKRSRYNNDPEYRMTVRERAKQRRVKDKETAYKVEKDPKYIHPLKEVCQEIELPLTSFHSMVNNNYIPKPYIFRRKAFLSETQRHLLTELVNTFEKGRKVISHPTAETQKALDNLLEKWNK